METEDIGSLELIGMLVANAHATLIAGVYSDDTAQLTRSTKV